LLADQGSSSIFFAQPGSDCSWSLAFPIVDISIRSGDICDRI